MCCISSSAEAATAVAAGVDAIAQVSAMPSGPGLIPEARIAEIAATVPPGVESVLLTSRCDVDAIVAQQRHCGVSAIQLCDAPAPSDIVDLRRALPGISIIQGVHVVDVCTGLRTGGRLDAGKLACFVAALSAVDDPRSERRPTGASP